MAEHKKRVGNRELDAISIVCTKHDNANVVPADNDMNLIIRWDGTTPTDPEGAFVFDESNLYCTGAVDKADESTWVHEFQIVM